MPPIRLLKKNFQKIIDKNRFAEHAYNNVPLYKSNYRGTILEEIGRQLDEKMGNKTKKSVRSIRSNGARNGLNTAECDWERINTKEKIEHKSGVMQYQIRNKMWSIKFDRIKKHMFDCLIVCAFTPFGCWWYTFPKHVRLCSNGVKRDDKYIRFSSKNGITDTKHAWGLIKKKLDQMCGDPIGFMEWE